MLEVKAMILAAIAAALAAIGVHTTESSKYSVPYGATALGDAIRNETWAPESVVGANNDCKPTSAHPYPVVLVHASLTDEGSNWVTLAPLLANEGYCVYAFNYGETLGSLPLVPLITPGRVDGLDHVGRSAEELKAFVDEALSKSGASKVDLVGHSQGGMMPNYYIKYLGGASKVNVLIGLAPLNHGTTLDGITKLLEIFPFADEFTTGVLDFLGAPSLPEQEEKSAFVKKLFGGGDPVVSGVRYAVIETNHDEVVTPYTHAFLSGPGVTNVTIQEQCPGDPVAHIGMFDDSPSLQNVVNQLNSTPNPSFKASCTNYGQGI